MKEVKSSGRFRKDLKRFRNKPDKLEKLYRVVDLLRREEPLPRVYMAHMLEGAFAGHMECHIEGDLLLIWVDKETIKLVRLGSHAELFGR